MDHNGEANPKFVVTTLKPIEQAARGLYEDVYCARGDLLAAIRAAMATEIDEGVRPVAK